MENMKGKFTVMVLGLVLCGCKTSQPEPPKLKFYTLSEPCMDPTNPDCVSTNNPPITNSWTTPQITNAVGCPVIRLASLRQSFTTSEQGTLVSTNTGFVITPSNTVESLQVTTDNIRSNHIWLSFGVINTSTNRQYTIEVTTSGLSGFWFSMGHYWNGTGTNEHVWTTPYSINVYYDNLFFRVKDYGAAQ